MYDLLLCLVEKLHIIIIISILYCIWKPFYFPHSTSSSSSLSFISISMVAAFFICDKHLLFLNIYFQKELMKGNIQFNSLWMNKFQCISTKPTMTTNGVEIRSKMNQFLMKNNILFPLNRLTLQNTSLDQNYLLSWIVFAMCLIHHILMILVLTILAVKYIETF